MIRSPSDHHLNDSRPALLDTVIPALRISISGVWIVASASSGTNLAPIYAEPPQNHGKSLVPKLLSPAPVQKLLQNLLRQRAAIRDAVGIFEALGEAAPITKAIVLLKEYERKAFHSRVVRHLLEPSSDRAAYLLNSLQRAHDMVAA